jgi:hypothetical protein
MQLNDRLRTRRAAATSPGWLPNTRGLPPSGLTPYPGGSVSQPDTERASRSAAP